MNMKWLFLGIGIVVGVLGLLGIQYMMKPKAPKPPVVTTPA